MFLGNFLQKHFQTPNRVIFDELVVFVFFAQTFCSPAISFSFSFFFSFRNHSSSSRARSQNTKYHSARDRCFQKLLVGSVFFRIELHVVPDHRIKKNEILLGNHKALFPEPLSSSEIWSPPCHFFFSFYV